MLSNSAFLIDYTQRQGEHTLPIFIQVCLSLSVRYTMVLCKGGLSRPPIFIIRKYELDVKFL